MSTTIIDKTDFQQKADQLFDEFQRIKCCPGVTDEIIGLCDRAMKGIRSNIPLIDQREKLSERVTEMQRELTSLRTRLEDAQARNAQILRDFHAEIHDGQSESAHDVIQRLVREKQEAQARAERAEGALKEIAKDRSLKLSPEGICLECGNWTPVGYPEANDHKEGCSNTGYPKGFNPQRIAREALTPAPQGRTDGEKTDEELMEAEWRKIVEATRCKLPPKGWICTRSAGHNGPCAAIVATAPEVKGGAA